MSDHVCRCRLRDSRFSLHFDQVQTLQGGLEKGGILHPTDMVGRRFNGHSPLLQAQIPTHDPGDDRRFFFVCERRGVAD
jgi:hypothetical protein